MAVQSMTGFARSSGQDGRMSWVWEVRSVNGRALDVRVRVPQGFDRAEQAVREAIRKQFHRGNISLSLSVERTGDMPAYRVNRDLLAQVLSLQTELAGQVRDDKPSLEGLLAVRGMLEAAEEAEEEAAVTAREAAIIASGEEALAALAAARGEEGKRLAPVLEGHLTAIATLTEQAAETAAAQPGAIRTRLHGMLKDILDAEPAVSEERLAQEVALLAGKADVREELDRLRAHVQAAHEMLSGDGAVGRRLDFLCQEFNRESNTLCSKSADVALTRIGLDLKAAVEQLREQVQNVE